MLKILVLTRYERTGASSRLRFYQFIPCLESKGMSITISPLFSDAYVKGLQKNNKNYFEVLKAYSKRAICLLTSKDFDLIWIEKETLPWLPIWVEKLLMSSSVPYVLDYDDAVFHYYDEHANPLVRSGLRNKHPKLMKGASLVVVGNEYLADYAKKVGATNIKVIPTVIDLDRYSTLASKNLGKELPRVGWIGQHSTATYLMPYADIFNRIKADKLAHFVAIGINTQAFGLPMTSIPWSEVTEVASIASFDIGIMPLLDGSFERGKCGYKLIQYMACALPVVASPVGVNAEIVEHGINGFLAETETEWEFAIRTLLADPALRLRMGQAGRQKVIDKYCIQKIGPTLSNLLIEASET